MPSSRHRYPHCHFVSSLYKTSAAGAKPFCMAGRPLPATGCEPGDEIWRSGEPELFMYRWPVQLIVLSQGLRGQAVKACRCCNSNMLHEEYRTFHARGRGYIPRVGLCSSPSCCCCCCCCFLFRALDAGCCCCCCTVHCKPCSFLIIACFGLGGRSDSYSSVSP